MNNGTIAIDIDDETLQDELQSVEYSYNRVSGGLVIESKDDMRRRGQKSPDYADAAVFAAADITMLMEEGPQAGDRITAAPEDLLTEMPLWASAMAW